MRKGKIVLKDEDKKWYIAYYVYRRREDMRTAIKKYCNQKRCSRALRAMCITEGKNIALFFCEYHLTVGVLSHEILHAARHIAHRGEEHRADVMETLTDRMVNELWTLEKKR